MTAHFVNFFIFLVRSSYSAENLVETSGIGKSGYFDWHTITMDTINSKIRNSISCAPIIAFVLKYATVTMKISIEKSTVAQ